MISFKPIADDEPALAQSALFKAARLTIDYIESDGPISLTPSKALKRYFVQWAAEAFAWPHYTAADLYSLNKVLNEQDFPPLVVLHDVLLSARLVRHYMGAMRLTELGRALNSRPAELWKLLASHLLVTLDHTQYTRYGDRLVGNWDIFLNLLNIETQAGVSVDRLCSMLFGGSEEEVRRYDYRLAATFYIQVLRPLCWIGLMEELRFGTGVERQELFIKTPLWPATLALETDALRSAATRH